MFALLFEAKLLKGEKHNPYNSLLLKKQQAKLILWCTP